MAEFDNGKYVVKFDIHAHPDNSHVYMHLSVWHRESEVGSEIAKNVQFGKTIAELGFAKVNIAISKGIAEMIAELMESVKPEGFVTLEKRDDPI